MKTKSMVLAMLASVAIGAIAVKGLYAQTPSASKPPAFYISEFEVIDREGMKPYSAHVASTFEPFGGRYIVRGGKIASLEGDAPKGGVVVIAFESLAKAQAWYDSPAYQEIKAIRHKAARSRVFIMEGTAK